MSEPSNYLAMAYLISAHSYTQNSLELPDSYEGVHLHVTNHYDQEFSEIFTRKAVEKLADWGFLEIVSDPYAGDLIISDRKEIAQPLEKLHIAGMTGLYNAAYNGGAPWFSRVFSNDEYWRNFSAETEGERFVEDIEVKGEIPASDRLVHLDHNQSSAIDDPLGELIDRVEPENSIDGEPGLRELILGKLRAGRELVRAGVFSIQSLQLTLVVGLKMLVERYKDTATAVAAAKLLDLLLTEFGIG